MTAHLDRYAADGILAPLKAEHVHAREWTVYLHTPHADPEWRTITVPAHTSLLDTLLDQVGECTIHVAHYSITP